MRSRRTLRQRGRWLTAVVLVLLLVVSAGLVAVQKWPGIPVWAVVALAALATLAAGAGPMWRAWREQSAAATGTVRRSLRGTRGASGNRLPAVADVDLRTLRVHQAVVDVPYLPRPAKEQEVADRLTAGRPVLLIGSSMVGKTRLAAEVVKRLYPDRPILVPEPPAGLADLDRENLIPRGHVIWLDDLDRFLGGGGLTAGAVDRLAGDNAVIATLRAKEWDRYQPTDELRPAQWDVLTSFEKVTLDRERDQPSTEHLERAIPDPKTRERIRRFGIGEYVGAAQHIRDQLELGAQTNPIGHALVLAAADWWYAGITRPVPAELLPKLAATRLPPRRRGELAEPDACAGALRWATREVNPTVSLLQPREGAFTVYDLALDHLANGHTVPEDAWHLIIDAADDRTELLEVGFQAMARYGRPDIAERAWRRAADAGDVRAATNMAVVLVRQGKSADALTWARNAADAGEPRAVATVGALLHHRGELAEAEVWHRRAAEAGQANAMRHLAMLLRDRGDLDEAEAWYRRAVDAGDTEAVHPLAALIERRGDLDEAEAWYRKAAAAGDTAATYNLGNVLRKRGRLVEAQACYREAAGAGLPVAMTNLALLLVMNGEVAEGEMWARKAAEAGHASAMNCLAVILLQRNEPDEALVWFRKAAEAGDVQAASNLLALVKAKGQAGGRLPDVMGFEWTSSGPRPATGDAAQ
jgi:TPR repeat protein